MARSSDPVEAWKVVRGELDSYGAGLDAKREIIALTKADLLDEKQRAKIVKALEKATGATVFPISAPLDEGHGAIARRPHRAARRRRRRTTMSSPGTKGAGRRYEACDYRRHGLRRRASYRYGACRRSPGQSADPPRPAAARRLEWVRGDLDDRAALEILIDGADAVIHAAGVITAANAAAFELGNVAGTLVDARRRDRGRRSPLRPCLVARRA